VDTNKSVDIRHVLVSLFTETKSRTV